MFGYAGQPGMTVGCVNPARPGADRLGKLDSYWYARSSLAVTWRADPPGRPRGSRPRPTWAPKGLVSAKCVSDGQRGYLSIRTNRATRARNGPTASAARSTVLGMFLPGWGMHLADMAEAQGDLIRLVGEIGSTLQSRNSCSTLSPRTPPA